MFNPLLFRLLSIDAVGCYSKCRN